MKKVSIVVLVYNVEKYIEKCMDSLVNQSYDDYKIIIINDGSNDSSLEKLQNYQKQYPELVYIYTIKNGGRSNARNYGISKVDTEFFTFVDGDDYLDLDTISKLVRNLKKDTDISICNSMRVFNDKEKYLLKFFRDDIKEKNKAMMVSYPGPCGKLYRTSFFRENNIKFPDDVNYCEDMAIIPTLGLYTNKITYINEGLYKYVNHDDSAIRPIEYDRKRLDDIMTVINVLDKKFGNKYKEELEYIYIEHILRTTFLRYSCYKESIDVLNKLNDLFHQKYPQYYKNKYYQKVGIKFKALCFLSYHRCYAILRILAKLKVR